MTDKAHTYPVTDHLCDGGCIPEPKCDQTAHWDTYTTSGWETVSIDLECELEAGHLLWHKDGEIYWDKYQENRTADMNLVEAYVDYRIQQELVRLSRKGLL